MNDSDRTDNVVRVVRFSETFRFWAKFGFISFGGPAGQIALMHKELVEKRRWLNNERFLHALNYCMLLPGPEAKQLAIYIGWLMHRTRGGIAAGLLFILPSIIILLALSYIYAAFGNVPAVAGVLEGFKPIVVAVVVEAVLKIGSKALKTWVHFVVAAVAFGLIYFLHVPFPLIIFGAAAAGLAGARLFPEPFTPANLPQAAAENDGSKEARYVISDHTAPPAHTIPNRVRVLKILAVGFALWIVPFAALGLWQGWNGLHSHEYRYFTQAALVTFGGAYAVLAYVTQAAAGPFGWITKAQAVDGLALAETTPGPLIMVLQFIGFMAAWNNPVPGMSRTASAVVGALITTYVTFLPSFLFIFIGAPYIEVLRGNRILTGALSGVTAAVVGVVLNLAIVFGVAVIFPQGTESGFEWFAAALSIGSFIAVYRYKIDVLWVILTGGALGLVKTIIPYA